MSLLKRVCTAQYPHLITWYITSTCNYACPMCFTKDLFDGNHTAELSVDEIDTVLADIVACYRANKRTCEFILSGGEPFARSDMFDILNVFEGLKCTYRLATNLSYLDENAIVRLASAKAAAIGVSLHCLSSEDTETHESYDIVERKLLLLRNANQTVKIILCVPATYCTPSTASTIVSLARTVQAKINLIHINFTDNQSRAAHEAVTEQVLGERVPPISSYTYHTTTQELSARYGVLSLLSAKAKKAGVAVMYYPTLGNRIHDYYCCSETMPRMRCGVRGKEVRISPQGIVFPCVPYRIGDLRTESFHDIWQSSRSKLFRTVLKKQRAFPGCCHCNKMMFC